MVKLVRSALGVLVCFFALPAAGQIVLNEGSNRNFNTVLDEDGDAPDWVELYNAGTVPVDLNGWRLTDMEGEVLPGEGWAFGPYVLAPGAHVLVFCSGKNRQSEGAFTPVAHVTNYAPTTGWNEHAFDAPFVWDGVSDLVVNTCSYSDAGYITNAVLEQSTTPYTSSTVAYVDGNASACGAITGETHGMRPRIQLNGIPVGNFTASNGTTWYPAPYGNWYWCARNQMLYRAEELTAAGLTAGPLTSLGWNVTYTDAVTYTYVDIALKQVSGPESALTGTFLPLGGIPFHADFSIDTGGEVVRLLNPAGTQVASLAVASPTTGASRGGLPDGSGAALLLAPPTPGMPNGSAQAFASVSPEPVWSLPSGVYPSVTSTSLTGTPGCVTRFTTDGHEPEEGSPQYEGQVLPVVTSKSFRARTWCPGLLPSNIASASYLINVNHSTPVVAVAIDPDHLYGGSGIFDQWWLDDERFADVAYFAEDAGHSLVFTRPAVMQIDGGAGGSRSHPQHSFRLELATGALGGAPAEFPLLPVRPERDRYSKLYFRNGSNQWLTLPYKDAALVELMAFETNGYGSGMRPASVYLNGEYFGVYEMREKIDEEFFEEHDGATAGTMDILTVSYWYGGTLRANAGEAEDYWDSWAEYTALDPGAPGFIEAADAVYDLDYLSDYIIGETWVANVDWPYNNIKLYRSDATGDRWRFATIDLELSLAPNGWTDCNSNGVAHALAQGEGAPFTGAWQRALGNPTYRHAFINRYADVMNTAYRPDRLLEVAEDHFDAWVVEMPREYGRWADPNNVEGWMDGFIANHAAFTGDLLCKSESAWSHVRESFGLSPTFGLTLASDPPGAGLVRVNTIVPEPLPWDGRYYRNHAIELEAFALPGYQFMFWEPNPLIANLQAPVWQGEISAGAASFTAVFAPSSTDVVSPESAAPPAVLSASPNPTAADRGTVLHAPARRIAAWSLYDAQGQLTRSGRPEVSAERLPLDLSGLAPGLYFVRVTYLDGGVGGVRVVVGG